MIDMTKPSHTASVEDVEKMPEDQWLKLVGELAYPQRAATMVRAVTLAKGRGVKHIVETGCIRGWAGDGQSTLILAMLAVRLQGTLETFDINSWHITQAQKWLGPFRDHVTWSIGDSVTGLSLLQYPIEFVYLDSYDYSAANPRPCQLHQLAEVGAVYGKLADNALLMMDDASLDGGGKVAMAVDFLKSNGWKIDASEYQIILSR